jgi:23S rRNA pseudouridine1911/1915/1917 synthase
MNEEPAEDKIRLDQRVLGLFPARSRAFVIRLIREGKVAVNKNIVTKAGHKLRAGDKIKVDYDEAEAAKIPDIELPILYEDESCIVVDKPVGILSHSKGAFNPEATVASWLAPRTSGFEAGSDRTGIVHRLDRATSGVMICAKTPGALTWLQKQFSTRKTKKTYIAVIEGTLDPKEAIIDMPIERNPAKPQRFRVNANGRTAVTRYKVLKEFGAYSEIELQPQTGRTHQLRVHLAHQKHPILGDTFYDGKPADRMYLHAHKLELTLPNKERKVFVSSVPSSFRKPKVV